MPSFKAFISITTAAAFANGCGIFIPNQHMDGSHRLASHALPVASEVETCMSDLQNAEYQSNDKLDSGRIRLVSWNVEKGLHANWRQDFSEIADGRDLVLIQEAIWRPDGAFGRHHWAFAPGYRSRKHLSGVMTYSNSEPLAHCNFISWEPWLGTPKATNITEYGLTGTDQTVLVVNIHAINFTIGLVAFVEQLERIRPVLAAHSGPIILSGDFNTWRRKRTEILDALADDFNLTSVEFDDDHRKMFFGQPLDHIYVRGLRVGASDTRQLSTSDHNPLLVEFSL